MQYQPSEYAGITGALIILGIIVAVLWIALPFAVFGIKKRIDRGNALLQEIRDALNKS